MNFLFQLMLPFINQSCFCFLKQSVKNSLVQKNHTQLSDIMFFTKTTTLMCFFLNEEVVRLVDDFGVKSDLKNIAIYFLFFT